MQIEGNWSILAMAALPGASVVTAGNTNNGIFAANALVLFALPPNSKVLLLYCGTRANAAAGGTGIYNFRINGVDNGVVQTFGGTQRASLYLATRLLLGPGNSSIDVKCTAAVGDETIHDSGVMFALGSIGT